MKYLTLFVMSVTVLLFAACASGGGEATIAPEATETKSALATAVSTPTPAPASYPTNDPTALPVESYPGAAPILETYNPYPDQQSEAAADVITATAYPAEAGNGDPQAAPQPGLSNDTTAVIQQVSEDLAQRLAIDVSAVTAVETDAVEWSDSSLGCPAEGFAYAQVITPGLFIELEASGQPYIYHTDLNGNFVLCSEDGSPVSE